MKKGLLRMVTALIFGTGLFSSCIGNPDKESSPEESAEQTDEKLNDELKGYMLAGIYTISGYGGINAVEKNIGDNDETVSYMQLLAFPFEKGMGGVKEELLYMWDIDSKDDLIKTLETLLYDQGKYKAWNYVSLVNNVNMGYAMGYLTKEEGEEWINKTLSKAKESFKTWRDFHKNFMEGRKNWNPKDEQTSDFEELSKEISSMSVYENNPLN